MAAKVLGQENLTCVICLDLFNDPVNIPCGHSYCRKCVQRHWDQEDDKPKYSCPECRERFRPRPVLVKSVKIAALVEQVKKMADDCVAGPGDVACDLCTDRKLKAARSCLQCVASYCTSHLQPHYDAEALQKHQLVAPSDNLQEYLCSEHNEVKKMFCRTDQQLLCVVCCMDQHKGHDTVSSAAERGQKQKTLKENRDHVIKTISERETDLNRLQQEAQAISRSAQTAVQHNDLSFTEMIRLLEKRHSEVEQDIRSQEMSQLSRVQELQNQVQLDLTELKRILSEMNTLLDTPDHNHFLQHFSQLPKEKSTTAVSRVCPKELHYFDSVLTSLSALSEKLQLSLTQGLTEVSTALCEVDTLVPLRKDFLKYACDITLDPNTAHKNLRLSEGNRRVTFTTELQNYPDHPDRFISWHQVLSSEALTGRCYWEVEKTGKRGVHVAVAYKDLNKPSGRFGTDNRSWTLDWFSKSYSFEFNTATSQVSGPVSSRLGVFLDHSAGLLSFYSVQNQSLILLHRVQARFTRPLHVGLWIFHDGHSVFFPQVKP